MYKADKEKLANKNFSLTTFLVNIRGTILFCYLFIQFYMCKSYAACVNVSYIIYEPESEILRAFKIISFQYHLLNKTFCGNTPSDWHVNFNQNQLAITISANFQEFYLTVHKLITSIKTIYNQRVEINTIECKTQGCISTLVIFINSRLHFCFIVV